MIGKIFRDIPAYNLGEKPEQFLGWCGKNIRPHQQKLILGATALATQPFFDLYNKKVDEDTRKVSCARTIAKIIVGTATGVYIRRKFIQLVEKNSEIGDVADKAIKNFFTPSMVKAKSMSFMHYRNTLGTFLAIGTMIITNFAVDAPLTQLLTNLFTRNIHTKKTEGVNNGKH